MPPSTEQTLDAPSSQHAPVAAGPRPGSPRASQPTGTPRAPVADTAVRASTRDAAVPRAASTGAGSAWRAAPESHPPARLSAMAQELLSHLPDGLLASTAARFPHVVDGLARHWSSPARFHRHLDRLVFDDRGGRAGFPPAVLNELAELRARYVRWVGPASRLGR